MKLIILSQYDQAGASSRIRIYNALSRLEAMGVEVTIRPLVTKNGQMLMDELASLGFSLKKVKAFFQVLWAFGLRVVHVWESKSYDAVLVQKDVLPFGLSRMLYFRNPFIIFDVDDAIWKGHPSTGFGGLAKAVLVAYRRHCFHSILRLSRCVLVDNQYLKEYSQKYCSRVELYSAPIDSNYYKLDRKKSDKITLGWIGSPGTTYLLEGMFPFLEKLSEVLDFRLVNLGGYSLSSKFFEIRNVSWSIEEELKQLQYFSVGLMPLDDSEFNKGKLGYKIVQYMSASIPVIGTDTGCNREIIRHGENGYLYSNDDVEPFVEMVLKIVKDQGLNTLLGKNGRELILEKYDIDVQVQSIERILKECQKYQ